MARFEIHKPKGALAAYNDEGNFDLNIKRFLQKAYLPIRQDLKNQIGEDILKQEDQRQGVEIHRKEFDDLMRQFDAKILHPRNTSEIVYRTPIPSAKDLSIWVYSTIHRKTGVSRKLGADAIRIMMFYKDKKVVMRESKTLRKGNWAENVEKKVQALKNRATGHKCPQGHPLVLRDRKKDGKQFYGCAAFPECRYIYKGERTLSEL